MKKIFLFPLFLILFCFLFLPAETNAGACDITLVECKKDPCELSDLLDIIPKIVKFLVFCVGPIVATFFLIVGGVLLLVSAGNPNLAGLGKKTLFAAIIGLFLVLCAWLIINMIVTAMGGTM